MKKILSSVLFIIMTVNVLFFMNNTSFAASPSVKYYSNAKMLISLGLMEDIKEQSDLEKTPTRLQGAVMLVKFLGKTSEAEKLKYKHPFRDVPKWANAYIGYLYHFKFMSGTSTTRFGPNDKLSADQYLTSILGILGYDSSKGDFKKSTVKEKSKQIKLLTQNEYTYLKSKSVFQIDDMVLINFKALTTNFKGTGKTLIMKLVDDDKSVSDVTAAIFSLYDMEIRFTDSNFEKLVRDALKKPSGKVYASDALKVTDLTSKGGSIKSINGIRFFFNLRTLYLPVNQITNISELKGLTNLCTLDLRHNNINTVESLSGLVNLATLDLSENNLIDVSPLSSLINLNSLNLRRNHIRTLGELKKLNSLTYLNLSKNQISAIDGVNGFNMLKTLNLSNNNITDLSAVSGLKNLENLSLIDNDIIQADKINGLDNLNSLQLQGYKLKDISIFKSFPKLQQLFLMGYGDTLDGFSKFEELMRKSDEILNSVVKTDMSDYEKELAIHDYVVKNTVYDYDFANTFIAKPGKNPINSYGSLIQGEAVCSGYAEAMNFLLNRAGIKSVIVIGDIKITPGSTGAASHAWNIVTLDGEYYHVDATWDNPSNMHAYFNVTDEEMDTTRTWDRNEYPACTGTKYEYVD